MKRVLFAPDWRGGVAYQALLAEALGRLRVEIVFPTGFPRLLPLARSRSEHPCNLLHLHWPEAYFPTREDAWDKLRLMRFPLDLALACRKTPLVLTAHNLEAQNREHEPLVRRNAAVAYRRANAIIAHSEAAKALITERFGLAPERCHVIPHGDLSAALGQPVPADEARQRLDLGPEKICLMFGTLEPNRGAEELIAFWKETEPSAVLALVGKPHSDEYGAELTKLTRGVKNVLPRIDWVSENGLRLWLSAANCAIFNYRTILSSGAACLARSWGLPILIPERLVTVDLDEPHPAVFRFNASNLSEQLARAIQTPRDFEAAKPWRELCDWNQVAARTLAVYEQLK